MDLASVLSLTEGSQEFGSVADLEAAIDDYVEHHNADPKPFIWTAPVNDILEKVARGRQVLESVH